MACKKEIMDLGWMLWKRSTEIRSCIEILANDIKVNTADEYIPGNNNIIIRLIKCMQLYMTVSHILLSQS